MVQRTKSFLLKSICSRTFWIIQSLLFLDYATALGFQGSGNTSSHPRRLRAHWPCDSEGRTLAPRLGPAALSSGALPKYWSFSFSISPSNEYSGLISFRLNWLGILAVQGTLESSPTPQFKSISSLVLSFSYGPALTSIHDYWKNHGFD